MPQNEIRATSTGIPVTGSSSHATVLHALSSGGIGSNLRRDETLKRCLDVFGAAILIVAFAPLWLATIVLALCCGPSSVFFSQQRIGRGNFPFTIVKFKTLTGKSTESAAARERQLKCLTEELSPDARPDPETGLFKDTGDMQPTSLGRILRRYSIDEIPQLWNVLKGDMSLVGPRPALPWEVGLFSQRHLRRHEVRPGVTGLWQVSGRNRISTLQMLELDLVYVEQRSFLLDMRILLQTPRAVFRERNTR